MADGRDKIDLSRQALNKAGIDPQSLPDQHDESRQSDARPWISVYFECCRIYCRVYVNAQRTAYVGWCPKCAARVEVRIASDGSPGRFFRAT